MSDTTIAAIPTQDQPLEPTERARSTVWTRIALGAITLVSIVLNFFQLGQNGFPNPFYGAGLRSMMDSIHNFFFVAYDPGAFVTLDKPPLGFWIQTISAKIFGFSAFSALLPEALAGVFSVLLLYYLVRRHFGEVAALLAALALAISPISVLTNRNNTIDSLLALTMLIGAWTVLRAAETGKLRWLLLCAVTVGLGFNIKMAEALLVVPAFGLLYLLAAPQKIRTRIWHLALALVLMLALSFSWIVTVDAIPASQRPYVDSTQDNSEFSLAVGYNGIQRLLGNVFNRGGGATNRDRTTTTPSTTGNNTGTTTNTNGQTPQPPSGTGGTGGFPGGAGGTGTGRGGAGGGTGGFPGGGAGGAAGFDIGTAGVTRLFTETLGGQISWLLPLALLGILALAWQRRRTRQQDDGQRRTRYQDDPHQQSMILWGTWLLTTTIFFSVAGFFHQYYLSVMAPALCAMFGIGVVVMWNDFRQSGWRGWLLPIALVLTAALQISFIVSTPSWGTWLIPIIAIASALAVIALVTVRLFPRVTQRFSSVTTTRTLQTITALSLAALMLTSAVWSVIPVIQNSASQLPTAGPSGQGGGFGGGSLGGGGNTTSTSQTALIQYLEANQGSAKYLVAVPSSMSGDSLIVATNKPVMSLGGFGGSDPILTTSQLQTLISNGTVRFFLLNGGGFGGGRQFNVNDLPQNIRKLIEEEGGFGGAGGGGAGGFGGQNAGTTWVTQHCAKVPASKWQSSSTSTNNTSGTLYDCAGAVK